MHPKTACSHRRWGNCTSGTMLVRGYPLQECSLPQRKEDRLGEDSLSVLPCLMIPFLSKTHPPVSDHCSLSQGLKKSSLFGCLPKHSGKDCAPFKCLLCVPFTVYKGLLVFYCFHVAYDKAIRPSTADECFPLPP